MSYEEHTDYDIIQSTNPEFHQAVVRINIHDERSDKTHRQTIQYLHPTGINVFQKNQFCYISRHL